MILASSLTDVSFAVVSRVIRLMVADVAGKSSPLRMRSRTLSLSVADSSAVSG
jgi:hypothetical protein